ncbi:hypothetical protein Tco_0963142 [Tanacetum coccineum]
MEECHKMLTNHVDWTNPEGDKVRINVNRPLPLDGPPGHDTIQIQFFFNKDLEYLRYGNKGSRPALLISKMKAARYPDFGLELLVPEQMWIDEVCIYDISDAYGISHWWFNRHNFYIERHDSPSRQREVRNHMRILSVVSIKPIQDTGHLDHLSGSDKRMLSTAVKLWTRNLIIQFNKIYKFSDRTLTRILEVLDYKVKEFKVKRLNLGMNTRFWTEKDVTRSKEFIAAIEGRLKTRRIYDSGQKRMLTTDFFRERNNIAIPF